MQIKKVILSLLLLLTYSLGFAHNSVPHCSNFANNNDIKTHKHHQYTDEKTQNSGHNHVIHNNHFDEGIYDFIVCLVHETDDSGTECTDEHCFTINFNNISLKDVINIQSVIILFTDFNILAQSESLAKCFKELSNTYLSPPITISPHRGPPVA